MRARLTAALLAPKGGAFPLGNAYANPLLDPIPGRREAPPRRARRPASGTARCRVAPDLYARLRILAARQGKPVRSLVETAVDAYLSAHGENCPCVLERPAGTAKVPESGCCLSLG
ncbi:MAG TPA: hypothetical protein VFY87_12950 [Geminicoccaceae bacterium]|nr:hypothetical protein [Geminicoccaceae bacterium]